MKVLFVFIVLEHRRRQVLHFNVREHLTAPWTSPQIVEAFLDRDAPQHTRDRDSIYDARRRISAMGIEELLTAPRSPRQNPYAERLIGSIRRDSLEPFRHPEREASEASPGFVFRLLPWFPYLDQQCPFPRQVSSIGSVTAIPQLGGLHPRYERVAA
jgi:hypothetical protein